MFDGLVRKFFPDRSKWEQEENNRITSVTNQFFSERTRKDALANLEANVREQAKKVKKFVPLKRAPKVLPAKPVKAPAKKEKKRDRSPPRPASRHSERTRNRMVYDQDLSIDEESEEVDRAPRKTGRQRLAAEVRLSLRRHPFETRFRVLDRQQSVVIVPGESHVIQVREYLARVLDEPVSSIRVVYRTKHDREYSYEALSDWLSLTSIDVRFSARKNGSVELWYFSYMELEIAQTMIGKLDVLKAMGVDPTVAPPKNYGPRVTVVPPARPSPTYKQQPTDIRQFDLRQFGTPSPVVPLPLASKSFSLSADGLTRLIAHPLPKLWNRHTLLAYLMREGCVSITHCDLLSGGVAVIVFSRFDEARRLSTILDHRTVDGARVQTRLIGANNFDTNVDKIVVARNLPADWDEEAMKTQFRRYGPVSEVRINPGQPRVAFIAFSRCSEAKAAIQVVHGYTIPGSDSRIECFSASQLITQVQKMVANPTEPPPSVLLPSFSFLNQGHDARWPAGANPADRFHFFWPFPC